MRVPSLESRVVHVVGADGFSRYISVSNTWQWLYLAWTFRNFSHLPETVLSSGQRHLLGRLRCNGAAQQRIDSSQVIGTFELTAKSCEELFQRAAQPVPAKLETKAIRKPQIAVAPPVQRSAKKAPVLHQKPVTPQTVRPNHRSTHTTAVAACILVLFGAVYGWQRIAKTGYVPPAVTTFADLTPAVAAAPAPEQLAPPQQAPAAPVIQPVTEPVVGQQAEPVAAPQTPASASAATTNPPQIAEVRPVPATRPEPRPTKMEKTENSSVSMPALDSLRQDVRPKRLIYPPAGTRAGKVVLGVIVDPSGTVDTVQVVSGDPALAKAAVETVKAWHYQATDGEQFKSVVTVTFMGDDAVMVGFPTQAELAAGR